jgi:pimeloyl-ACP methyl ester carboxylesterase
MRQRRRTLAALSGWSEAWASHRGREDHTRAMSNTLTATTSDGRTLGICCWGDPEGAPVFWLHGTPGSRLHHWAEDEYQRHRLRVVTYDRPGYGLSTRQPGRRVADAAGDVRAVADALGLATFGVAGVSGGAGPALACGALMPDRVLRCLGVVGHAPYVEMGGAFLDGMDDESRDGYRRALVGEEALASEWRGVEEWIDAGLPGVDDTEVLMDTLEEARRQGSAGFVDDLLADVADWGFAVGEVRVPTKWLLGAQDTSVPHSHGAWLQEHLPNGEVMVRDGSHFGPFGDLEMDLLIWAALGTWKTSARGAAAT